MCADAFDRLHLDENDGRNRNFLLFRGTSIKCHETREEFVVGSANFIVGEMMDCRMNLEFVDLNTKWRKNMRKNFDGDVFVEIVEMEAFECYSS
jgi:hypothetical protein